MTFKALNIFLCLVHIILAVGFAIYFTRINSRVSSPLDMSIRDHELITGVPVQYESIQQHDTSLVLVETLVIAFFVVTAVFHGLYAFTANTTYMHMIQKENNWIRWLEYSISSTIMIYIIAFMSGVKDINTYILLLFLNVCMVLQGQSVEINRKRKISVIIPLVTGFLLLGGEWTVIIKDFFRRIQEVKTITGQSIPTWLPTMIFVLFVFYACFGFVSTIGAITKLPYVRVEQTYLWLSLASKATLGAFIAYGLGQRATMRNERT